MSENAKPVLIESQSSGLFPEIHDGAIRMSVYLDSSMEEFHQAAEAHCSEDPLVGAVQLLVYFPPSLLLDSLGCFEESPLEEGERPVVEALKVELEKMLARISQIKYSEPEQVAP